MFFDRDDTLIENATLPPEAFAGRAGDLADPAWVRPLPGAAEACRRAIDLGFVVVIVTNQGVVARGGATLDEVKATCSRAHEMLDPDIACTFACPFHPKGQGPAGLCREHSWRKPAPGMLLASAELLGLDLSRSWMIGDALRDIEAGRAAGIPAEHCVRVDSRFTVADAIARVTRALVADRG